MVFWHHAHFDAMASKHADYIHQYVVHFITLGYHGTVFLLNSKCTLIGPVFSLVMTNIKQHF